MLHGPRVIRYVIEVALRIGHFVVDGRRRDLVADRQDADARFDPPAPPSK